MKTYGQRCGVARALDLLGGRWTLLIVRDLLLGPTRYGVLLASLRGITTNLLAERLRALEGEGLVERTADAEGASAWRLTAAGESIEPLVMELGRFGHALSGGRGPTDRVELGWALLSLKRRYLGGRGQEVELRAGAEVFALTLLPSYLRVRRRPAVAPSLVVTGAAEALLAVLVAGVPPAQARGAIVVAGEPGAWEELLAAFAGAPLPGTPGPDPEPGAP